MPGWLEVQDECRIAGSGFDGVRRKYLKELRQLTGRNLIIYYSGWLQKGDMPGLSRATFALNDNDKNGFMAAIHKLDRSLGLDLVLHTPGGEMAATESLVGYLRSMFGTNVRAIVPQIAMSAGTMMALACKNIVMGKHSNLGPIDPQIGGVPAHGLIEEASDAITKVQQAPHTAPLYQMIFSKYSPTLLGEAQKAIIWSEKVVTHWLETGMFDGDPDASGKARRVIDTFGDHALTLSHSRHISADEARAAGVVVDSLEADKPLQEAVLSLHHACIQTLNATNTLKIIENHDGVAFIMQAATMISVNPLTGR